VNKLALLASHLATAALGFGPGVYLLPILIAPPAPTRAKSRRRRRRRASPAS
jgi:hypothetical protein